MRVPLRVLSWGNVLGHAMRVPLRVLSWGNVLGHARGHLIAIGNHFLALRFRTHRSSVRRSHAGMTHKGDTQWWERAVQHRDVGDDSLGRLARAMRNGGNGLCNTGTRGMVHNIPLYYIQFMVIQGDSHVISSLC